MLTDTRSDDDLLIRAAPHLPGLGTLLHEEALTEFLSRHDPQVLRANATYLRYKPDTVMLAAVTIQRADGEHLALGHSVADGRLTRLAKVGLSASKAGTWRHLDTARRLGISGAAADRRLPGLARQLRRSGVQTLRYKPARRWVGRRQVDGRDLLVKVFSRGGSRCSATASAALAAAGVPGPVLFDELSSRDTLRFVWQEGTTLDRLEAVDLSEAGRLLARLHEMPWPLDDAARAQRRWHLGLNGSGLDDLAAASPTIDAAASSARQLASRLRRRPTGSAMVTSHGDFSADQVLREPGGSLRLLDLDSIQPAPREVDLGSWIGDALARASAPDADPQEVADDVLNQSTDLIGGYQDAAGHAVDRQCVLTTAAIGLMNRATEPFRLRDPHWISTAAARIAVAAVVADSAARL